MVLLVLFALMKINNEDYMYSQTWIKRSPLGQGKNGLMRQVTS